MTPLRILVAVIVVVLVLFIGGCILYGVGTAETDVPKPAQTETTP
jgi:hypothetical protein